MFTMQHLFKAKQLGSTPKQVFSLLNNCEDFQYASIEKQIKAVHFACYFLSVFARCGPTTKVFLKNSLGFGVFAYCKSKYFVQIFSKSNNPSRLQN